MLVALHVFVHRSYIFVEKYGLVHGLVDNPLYLPHVYVALRLRQFPVISHGIETEQIEHQTVGNYHRTYHRPALRYTVKLEIQRIFKSKILVKTYSERIVAHDNALIERTYLGVNQRYFDIRNGVGETGERFRKVTVDLVHICILILHIPYQAL